MAEDPFAGFKLRQRELWSGFAPMATFTTPVAARLVRFAGVAPGEAVLDVGTGTGVVAITAALAGARASGLDLTPELLVHARDNARIAGLPDIAWMEGDAEALPFADASFDLVLSQFGHIFAPRPAVALSEMRRVLRPGGRIAFASWPPEHFVGSLFSLVARNSAPPPPGASPPGPWGDVATVTGRLADGFEAPHFARDAMLVPALGVAHLREMLEHSIGPVQRLMERHAGEPERLQALRREIEELARPWFADNQLRQDYLLVRARAR